MTIRRSLPIFAALLFAFAACDDDNVSDNNTNNTLHNNTNTGQNNTQNNLNNSNNNLTANNTNTTTLPECGNGVVEEEEVCDGSVPATLSCEEMGFPGGEATCSMTCTVDYATCTVGDGSVGSSCHTASDCNIGDLEAECHTELANPIQPENPYALKGGYCSAACDPAAMQDQCADFGGRCYENALLGIEGICLRLCTEGGSECRVGYQCQNFGGDSSYCLPPLNL